MAHIIIDLKETQSFISPVLEHWVSSAGWSVSSCLPGAESWPGFQPGLTSATGDLSKGFGAWAHGENPDRGWKPSRSRPLCGPLWSFPPYLHSSCASPLLPFANHFFWRHVECTPSPLGSWAPPGAGQGEGLAWAPLRRCGKVRFVTFCLTSHWNDHLRRPCTLLTADSFGFLSLFSLHFCSLCHSLPPLPVSKMIYKRLSFGRVCLSAI